MKFLFTYISMHTGGIETLIFRMSEWLLKNNHSVEILFLSKSGKLLDILNEKIVCHELGMLPEVNFSIDCLSGYYKKDWDVVFCFSPKLLWLSVLIVQQNKNAVLLNGVYHLYDYQNMSDTMGRNLFKNYISSESKLFMNPLVQKSHENIFGTKFQNSKIWPLPIDAITYKNINRNPLKYKVVSIGRLTGFKTYNQYMINVVKTLRDEGYNIEYYVYGEGEQFDEIQNLIKFNNLEESVFMKGTIDYNQISEVLADAFVFIGMGTSVIEAGLNKVPSIVAIAYSTDSVSHGFIHELPMYNCGEVVEGLKIEKVENLIKRLIELNDSQYQELCDKTYDFLSQKYDLNILMNDLINYIGENQQKLRLKRSFSMPVLYLIKSSFKSLFELSRYLLIKYDKTLVSIANNERRLNFILLSSPMYVGRNLKRNRKV